MSLVKPCMGILEFYRFSQSVLWLNVFSLPLKPLTVKTERNDHGPFDD
jgi:hypothetical protein